jgi:hypothetical protein
MRIVSVKQGTAPINSAIANAYIDFSKMTASIVAVTVEGDGRRVTGYGFNSNGRYAQPGLLAERFIPRLEACDAAILAAPDGSLNVAGAWSAMMRNEKPGGHGDRHRVPQGEIHRSGRPLRRRLPSRKAQFCGLSR